MSGSQRSVVIVGSDSLAATVASDLRAAGHRVTLIDSADADSLRAAGIASADALLALDAEDRVNLEAALEARSANPHVRIVMCQFNRALARKIEENLQDCVVVSPAAHSAATYAAAAVDPACFFGIEFPRGSHSLVGFARRSASAAGVAELSVDEIERRLHCRVLHRGGDELIVFEALSDPGPSVESVRQARGGLRPIGAAFRAVAAEVDPLLKVVIAVAVVTFVAATLFFSFALHLNPVTAAYFVTATMTGVGYGDIGLADKARGLQIADILLMVAGLLCANLLIAFVAAALIRGQSNALQGLRPIRDAGHIVVFGAGRVGTRVIDFLCELGALVTVVERAPSPELLSRARSRDVSLLTGDGALDETLDLANVVAARCVVVLTDNDATNLEIGLGARARRGDIPVIMRVAESRFAAAIGSQFQIRRAFSATGLTAAAFSDLAFSGTGRGSVEFGGRRFRVAESSAQVADRSGVLLAAGGNGKPARIAHDWNEVGAGDVVLALHEVAHPGVRGA